MRDANRRSAASVDSVIGIGQNRPSAVRMSSQTPFQSARVMKPSSGVKPPMPSMIRSPFSRDVMQQPAKRLRAARFLRTAFAFQLERPQTATTMRRNEMSHGDSMPFDDGTLA